MLLFKIDAGEIVPLAPGSAELDGVDVLTLEQASEKTGKDVVTLRELWAAYWNDIAPETDILGRSVATVPDLPSRRQPPELWENLTPAQQDEVMRELMYPHLTTNAFQTIKRVCAARRFSIYCKHLHAELQRDARTGRDRLVIMTSIDALRLVAQRSGEYTGPLEAMWAGEDGVFKEVWCDVNPPAWAKVGVTRRGYTQPVYGKASWASYAPYKEEGGLAILDPFWAKWSTHMLAKCAEALAIRAAFPEETAGMFINEEMQHRPPEPPRRQPKAPEDQRPADVSDEDGSLLDPVDSEDEILALVKDAGYRSIDAAADWARARYPRAWRTNKNGFFRLMARDLREMIKRKTSAA